MDIQTLNSMYKEWNKRKLSGTRYDSPMICINRELKELGYKRGDEVIVGVREDGVIEIVPVDMQGVQEGTGGQGTSGERS